MHNRGLGSWPARRARMSPARVALSYEGRDWTYAELASRVEQLAAGLARLGVGRGDRVGYLGQNNPMAVEILSAAGLLGAVYLPLNARFTADELAFIAHDAQPRLLVADAERVTVADQLPVSLVVDNLTWNTFNHLIDIDLRGDDVALLTAPLFHIAALAQSFLPLFVKGGRAVIVRSFDADRVLGLIESERITSMFGVPTMFALLTRSPLWPEADLSSLRILECGGAPVPDALIETYRTASGKLRKSQLRSRYADTPPANPSPEKGAP